MNVTERLALTQAQVVYDEVTAAVDERTLEIIERRRKTATIRRRGWLIRRMLLLADLLGLTIAFVLAEVMFGQDTTPVGNLAPKWEVLFFLVTLPGWIVVAKLYGLYDQDEERTDHSTADDFLGVFHLVTIGAWVLVAGAWATGLADPDFPKLITFWGLAVLLITSGRSVARTLSRRSITYLQNTIIVGAGDIGQLVAHKLVHHPEYGINLVGFVDAQPKERREDLGTLTLLGPPDRLPALVRVFDIERVIIAFSNDSHEALLEMIRALKDMDVQIDVVPRLFEILSPSVGIHTVEGLPVIGLPPLRLARSSRLLKRAIDIVGSVVGLVVLAPFFAYVAFRIKHDSPGPVFFRQVRMGAADETFRIYKFRTMTVDADERKREVAHLNENATNGGDPRMFKVANDPRVTPFGRSLRRYSLDELPQLINVLKGEMSFVGPRPLILDEDQYVDAWARRRLDLKPGITGLWQVLGRNEIPFREMVRLDYIYVTSWSLWRDVRLLFQTLPIVVKGQRRQY
jgi:exopolysaccharide biosynthesis polyprenyl glycosylphosphotransferase